MQPVFVGLDPSYTGFAMIAVDLGGSMVERLTIRTKPDEFAHRQERIVFIRTEVLKFLDAAQPMLVAIEGYAYGAMTNREILGELGGTVRVALFENSYSFVDVQPPTLKKYVLGKGNGPKSEMLRGVERKWGYDAKDDNDADAYGLCRLALEFSTPDKWTKAFKDLAKKIVVVQGRRTQPAVVSNRTARVR